MARKRKYRADVVDGEEQPVDASPVRKSNIGSRKLIVISFHPLFSSPSLSLPPFFFTRSLHPSRNRKRETYFYDTDRLLHETRRNLLLYITNLQIRRHFFIKRFLNFSMILRNGSMRCIQEFFKFYFTR